jgi:hypothetical protein
MYFKHPELLYALFLLVIPILVHLFQLRKFRTTEFTNVKFLKKAVLQTRKSSRLKKFLILCTRLLLLASVILAFAQPYFPPASGEIEDTSMVIYLDNSHSMQAKGKDGVLLRRSIQDLLEHLPQDEEVSLFTNDEEFRDISPASLRERLQSLDYSARQLPWDIIQLKSRDFFRNTSGQKKFIAISDFQHLSEPVSPIAEDISTYLVQMKPENNVNVSVDTAYISSRSLDEIVLQVEVSASGKMQEEVSIGLYNEDRMLTRKTVELDEELSGSTSLSFPSQAVPFGRISAEDNSLQFDNQLFFSINETPPVKVVVIGDHEAEFLERIYSSPEFTLNIFSENNIDYNSLSQANLVILNEVQRIPFSVTNTLEQLIKEQVFLVVIPSAEANLSDYNLLFRNLGLPAFNAKIQQEKLITDIIFDHPLYQKVFDSRVENFEYPRVQSFYPVAASASGILQYQDRQPFLYEQKNIFVFTAPLGRSNSNFKSAPLIVPTFYNIGNLTISPPELYYILGESQEINIQADLQKDEILKLSSAGTTYIPLQQSFRNMVALNLDDLPEKEGHYRVLRDSTSLRTLSFNVDRRESLPINNELQEQGEIVVFSSIPEVLSTIKSAGEVDTLWKCFVIFALFFLITEMLILKFLK